MYQVKVIMLPITSLIVLASVALAGITALVALAAWRSPPVRGIFTRATDMLPILVLQMIVALLVLVVPLTTSARADAVIALIFAASLVILAAITVGLGITNLRRSRARGGAVTPAPVLTSPPPAPEGVYRLVARHSARTVGMTIVLIVLSLAVAVDLIPWFLSELPDSFGLKSALGITGFPDGISNVLDDFLLVCGVIGLGMLLAGLIYLGRRAVYTADAQGLHLRAGIVRRDIPWNQARQFLLRDHGDGVFSYQLVGPTSQAVMWWDRAPRAPTPSPLRLNARELASVVAGYIHQPPRLLTPEETAALVRQRIQSYANQIAGEAERLH
jgi:hypothetical protein